MEFGTRNAVRCHVPYRLDFPAPPTDALDRLVALGALDLEVIDGVLAAILPDRVSLDEVGYALEGTPMTASAATARDDGSVWILRPRPVRVGSLLLVPGDAAPVAGALRLIDGPAFGTGLHPTTALCLELLDDMLNGEPPARVLDVGIGSGILALAALLKGVPEAVGVDIDRGAIADSAENARLNGLEGRLTLVHGGPEAVAGTWPLVVANVLPAPLIEMASPVTHRVSHRGRVVLSGIHQSMAQEVERAYVRLGMRRTRAETRDGWTALVLDASW